MKQGRHQSILHGAVILMTAALIVKIIGALFKIPLTQLLGGTGMGFFMTAFGLFNPVHALTIAGVPVAISKLVSENVAKGYLRDARRVFHLSLVLLTATGILGTLFLYFGSGWLAALVGNEQARCCLMAIAPAAYFSCVVAVFRGYYEGLRNMYPTAVSQVVEAVVKLVAGIALAGLVLEEGHRQFAAGGPVFGVAVSTLEQAADVILPYGAAGAVAGVALSELAGALFMIVRHLIFRDGISRERLARSARPISVGQTLRQILVISLPVCIGGLIINLMGLVDLMSIMNRLAVALQRDSGLIYRIYSGLIPQNLTLEQVPNYLYGSYTGLAMTIYGIVPAVTAAFGISALPAVSAAWSVRNTDKTRRCIESVLRLTAMIAIPAGLGICALSEPILMLLFSSRPGEVAIAAPLLRVLGVAVIFASMSSPAGSMLQGVGRADLPVKLMVLGGGVKLVSNYVFVAVPAINIRAAPWGNLICFLLIDLVSVLMLCHTTSVRIRLWQVFGKPLLAGAFCGVTAWASYGILSRLLDPGLSTLLSVGLGGFFYLVVLLLLKTITREDVLMVPKGEKVAKILEKFSLLG